MGNQGNMGAERTKKGREATGLEPRETEQFQEMGDVHHTAYSGAENQGVDLQPARLTSCASHWLKGIKTSCKHLFAFSGVGILLNRHAFYLLHNLFFETELPYAALAVLELSVDDAGLKACPCLLSAMIKGGYHHSQQSSAIF